MLLQTVDGRIHAPHPMLPRMLSLSPLIGWSRCFHLIGGPTYPGPCDIRGQCLDVPRITCLKCIAKDP